MTYISQREDIGNVEICMRFIYLYLCTRALRDAEWCCDILNVYKGSFIQPAFNFCCCFPSIWFSFFLVVILTSRKAEIMIPYIMKLVKEFVQALEDLVYISKLLSIEYIWTGKIQNANVSLQIICVRLSFERNVHKSQCHLILIILFLHCWVDDDEYCYLLRTYCVPTPRCLGSADVKVITIPSGDYYSFRGEGGKGSEGFCNLAMLMLLVETDIE